MASCCPTSRGAAASNKSYTFKGKEIENFGGLTTYVVGSTSNTRVLIGFMDIFGLSDQIKEGADKLADDGFTVYLPDFLEGKPLPVTALPPKTPEDQKLCNDFFSTRISPNLHWPKLAKVVEAVRANHGPNVTIGTYGFCWGAKVLVTYPATIDFVGIASCHPSFPDSADAANVHCPVLFLCSKDEDAKIIKEWEEAFKTNPAYAKSSFETFSDMFHGWMAARADLSNPEQRKRFDEGYQKVSSFFQSLM
ncbi:Dienelactone hydrolase family protein [Schizosaccharomyces pombe]|uniref:Uncharacterized AIM2 family protein C30D10.14 n=1 Tax=Schizosaccharomyces pombe (strain 972 / ATCC 24843) TaxID=284812 RepID=YB4E_SCHPO|nr:putative dienelactone hydrolase family protein [Schizosaccharomyces pombe]O14359.1 RecName: Full=Uncharacterized AIM2 family protein C30D10.14 [Schizosaccharomyces pombe 972h-]CAB10809.1 dienelactone hydrolase family (predicted) [Schizosaccharomyces pombe]|eukprot:NP_596271.1 putative dienelactone hydrolase family protein [Schizosaccharomyces pombe]